MKKNKLLLHICCAGCGAYVSQVLKEDYDIVLYYYNPCIFPVEEYHKRINDVEKIASRFNLDLIKGEYNHNMWLKKISGHENDFERGKRCLICYEDRIKNTAKKAKDINANIFTTTLTISPHKTAEEIIKMGNKVADENSIKFIGEDFKKKDGFKNSVLLSKKIGLYRQKYCGCEFSIR